MPITEDRIRAALSEIATPGGGDLISRDLIRALAIEDGAVRFVIELPSADEARGFAEVEQAARARLSELEGVRSVSIVTTAPAKAPPGLKIGRHPTPQAGPQPVPGVRHIVAVGSGKGGVGKSTLTTNLAVAMARAGYRVGVLDADIYGPSQPRMLGVSGRPASQGQRITPMEAHGVKMMSLGLMVDDGQAIVWRGPMLMGALQQMLGQVDWGDLDLLLIDLPPGTGDVQLTLSQKTALSGAVIVSTPQDVALIDARRALDMFAKVKTPVLGLVENMSAYICPNCGHEAHLFGHGGVRAEADRLGVPYLGEIPLELEIRLSGDAGAPAASGDGKTAEAFATLAAKLAAQIGL
ncbi:MAG: Mrp/NBP35 family ATP-binding protein [Paracoccus sp. (in: a-proteobacteria)]|nr:Mrp/NBP35 family ATP-binding protein [Paracoccus sp. (in: a-proteobacteria)]